MSADATDRLRIELKSWEQEFSKSHSGKKPSSADIKACPEIALKYKEYSKLRAPLVSNPNVRSTADVQTTPSKRRKLNSEVPLPATPRAGDQLFESPRKDKSTPLSKRVLFDENYHSPQSVKKFLEGERSTVGPTPQKNGLALGLFDLFSTAKRRKSDLSSRNDIQNTPSKSFAQPQSQMSITSPQSTSKSRAFSFRTPRKSDSNGISGDFPTPFKTPDFLKRSYSQSGQPPGLSAINESGEASFTSPETILPKRRTTGRGLSLILAGLRKMEDERLDEELELMREAEMEEEERTNGKVDVDPRSEKAEAMASGNTISEDSVTRIENEEFDPSMLEIPEDELSTDSEVDIAGKTALDRNGQPRKIYKKKGQKRTTRRVKMRPVTNAPKAHRSAQEIIDAAAAATVASQAAGAEDIDELSQDPFVDNEVKDKVSAKKEGDRGIKKTAKKISASAHANFRRLKIRAKGSKPGGRGRFFRRR